MFCSEEAASSLPDEIIVVHVGEYHVAPVPVPKPYNSNPCAKAVLPKNKQATINNAQWTIDNEWRFLPTALFLGCTPPCIRRS